MHRETPINRRSNSAEAPTSLAATQALSALSEEARIAVELIEWNFLRLTERKPLASLRIEARKDATYPRRGRFDLGVEFRDRSTWNVGIRYGRPLILRMFPRRSSFDMEAFVDNPHDPEITGLVLVERRECIAAAARIAHAVRERDPSVRIEWRVR